MILKALYDYYHRCGNLAKQGFETKEISFIIVVDAEGNLIDVEDSRTGDKKRGTEYLVPKGIRSGTTPKPYLFWDNVEYTCAYAAPNPKNSPDKQEELERKAKAKNKALVEKFKAIAERYPDNPAFKAVCLFYERGGLNALYAHPMWQDIIKKPTVNISYRLDNEETIIATDDDLEKEVADSADDDNGEKSAVCIITGKPCDPIESTTPTPIPDSQAIARLVSFQVSSGYDSYGKQKGLNAPMSREAESAYTTALNKLLAKGSRNKYTIGNRTFVFWGSSNSEASALLEDSLLKELYGNVPDSETTAGADDPNLRVEEVTKAFKAIYSGKVPGSLTDRFFILGLAPNAARIAVSYWSDAPLRDFAANILKHHEDMEVADRRTDKKPYTGIFSILRAISVSGKASDIKSNLPEAILKSIVEGTPYPRPLFQQVILRIHADHRVDIVRAGIIKAYLNRIDRTKSNQITVMINEDETNIGYLCGRLFALLEYTQRKAQGSATIADKYLGAAMSTPLKVFPALLKLTTYHLRKINSQRFKNYIEKIRHNITGKTSTFEFPAQLSLYDQGRFVVGYDHQMGELYSRKDKEEAEESKAENDNI